jgi:hypothetical protein
VAREPSPTWRSALLLRLVLGLALVLLVLAVVLVVRAVTTGAAQDPGVGPAAAGTASGPLTPGRG